MSNLFMDGMSHYATADILPKWTTLDSTGCVWTIEPAGGRNGGCLRKLANSNTLGSGRILKAPTVTQAGPWSLTNTGVFGCAIKITDLNRMNVVSNFNGEYFSNSFLTVNNGTWSMFAVVINNDGTISLWEVYSGSGLSQAFRLANSIGVLNNNSWAYLEMKWLISNSAAGRFILKANEIEVINYSGTLYPRIGGGSSSPPTAHWTSVQLLGQVSMPPPYFDARVCDLYLFDQNGAIDNDFLGDINISYIIPDGPGNSAVWTPSAGANWQNVNEVPPNVDVTYNAATNIASRDTYNFTNLGPNVIPLAVQHCIYARRTVPGSSQIASVVRQGSTDYDSTAQAIPNETYKYNLFPYDTNPATGVRFTKAEIDGGQFGVNKVT